MLGKPKILPRPQSSCVITKTYYTKLNVNQTWSHNARNFKPTNMQPWVIYSDSYINGIFFPTF